MLANPKFVKNVLNELEKNTLGTFIGGVVSLMIGYFLVTTHNVWVWNGSLIITVIGWLALVKGLALLVHPQTTLRFYKKILNKTFVDFAIWFIILLGVVSLYFGYFA